MFLYRGFSYKDVFLIKRFLVDSFQYIYIYIYIYMCMCVYTLVINVTIGYGMLRV